MTQPPVIVTCQWLAERLDAPDIVIADCRFDLADPAAGRRAYEAAHIPGAVYFDLEQDLSGPVRKPGPRHPLPDMDRFVAKLEAAGIGEAVTVVCYDDQQGMVAARLWWMLRYLGHEAVCVLDGGFKAWQEAGLPVTASAAARPRRRFVPRVRPEMAVSMADVQQMVQEKRGVLVDARAPERFRGEVEPLDPVAGHIPGARNLPWMGNLDSSGRWRSPEELAARFAALRGQEPVVMYCGSGVSACVNVLAMAHAGFKELPRLYVGSWSEWCAVPENPVAKVDTPERA
ncbi:MAG TPA: sulfurtransferase [Limnochordales bacterium]